MAGEVTATDHLAGISVEGNVFLAFVLMDVLYGVAAILFTARLDASTPADATFMELDAIAAAVIGGVTLGGGKGRIPAVIGGAVLLTAIDNGMSVVGVSSFLQQIVKGPSCWPPSPSTCAPGANEGGRQANQTVRSRNARMIKHIVMWNVRGDSPDDRQRSIELLKSRFEALKDEIPGLLRLEVGVDVSRVSYACDVVLYSEFESEEALSAYAEHPAHLRVRDELKDVRTARHQVDYPAA